MVDDYNTGDEVVDEVVDDLYGETVSDPFVHKPDIDSITMRMCIVFKPIILSKVDILDKSIEALKKAKLETLWASKVYVDDLYGENESNRSILYKPDIDSITIRICIVFESMLSSNVESMSQSKVETLNKAIDALKKDELETLWAACECSCVPLGIVKK